MPKENALHLLLIDDDAVDRELFIDAMNMAVRGHAVTEAGSGEEGIRFLNEAGRLPNLIILDLNMPVMDGRATLAELKKHELFRKIPVCIMSTSGSRFDVQNAYDSGASLFLVKPHDFKELIEMLGSLLTLFSKFVSLADPPAKSL